MHAAFMRTGPSHRADRSIYGDEAFGLAAAELALAKVKRGDPSVPLWPAYNVLLAALYENGLDKEAEHHVAELLTRVSESTRPQIERHVRGLAKIAREGEHRAGRVRDRIRELEELVGKRRTWTFADDADQFLHDSLVELKADIERFADTDVKMVAGRGGLGAGLRDLEKDPAYLARWRTASRAHPDLDLPLQHGLVPIGQNPKSGLWEFYHLRSAWRPETGEAIADIPVPTLADYDEHGGLRLGDRLRGMVFVLVPGGRFTIGAQDSDPLQSATTPRLPHRRLAAARHPRPYFLASTRRPRANGRASPTATGRAATRSATAVQGTENIVGWEHPVEQVTWKMADRVAREIGLVLPTEAQWELACRAGTDTPYPTGQSASSLDGFANVFDELAARLGGDRSDVAFSDGYRAASPVGSFRPNGLGFHDMSGNVWEWVPRRRDEPLLPRRLGSRRRPDAGAWRQAAHRARRQLRRPRLRRAVCPAVGRPIELRQKSVGVRFARRIAR